MFAACALLFLCVCYAAVANPATAGQARVLFDTPAAEAAGKDKLDAAFDAVYSHFNQTFDHNQFKAAVATLNASAASWLGTDGKYVRHKVMPTSSHCDLRQPVFKGLQAGLEQVAPYPGGSTRSPGDFSKQMADLAAAVTGPGSGSAILPTVLAQQALAQGLGMVQTIIATIVELVPPMIPPPVWINQPLPCLPMVTGHNCFGAVLHPITMSDFVVADITDAMLDGLISGFPNTYATKVGKTSDKAYKSCFGAFMSMHCSSLFPMCTSPFSNSAMRVPMCFHLCILPLVLCPGLWLDDVIGVCSMVSAPPMCSQAVYWNTARAPPQYTSYDQANPFAKDCPSTLNAGSLEAMRSDLSLYELEAEQPSEIAKQAGAGKSSASSTEIAALPDLRQRD